MAFSPKEGWGRGTCIAEHCSPVPWTHMSTYGSYCLWTVLVRPRWCMDMRVPASTCAITTPKGLHQSQEEEAPNVVTPPLSHWTHRAPQSLD